MIDFAKAPPLAFDTERLHVRRYRPGDAEVLFAAARESIETVYPFLPWCHPAYAIDDSRGWIASVQDSWQRDAFNFGIFDRETEQFLGGCGVNTIDEHPIANLGYWIRTSATGRAIATEATIALAQYGLAELALKRIEIIMATHNLASRKVAEKAGAIYEGILRNRLTLHGQTYDAYSYSIIR